MKKAKTEKHYVDMNKAIDQDQDQDQNNDYSDDESLKKAAQRCRENRKRLMRRKALQTEFPEEKSRKLIGEDQKKERNGRIHIRNIVEFERQKLVMEKKRRRREQTGGVRGNRDEEEEEEEAPRKSENSARFQESEQEMGTEMKNRIKKRETER